MLLESLCTPGLNLIIAFRKQIQILNLTLTTLNYLTPLLPSDRIALHSLSRDYSPTNLVSLLSLKQATFFATLRYSLCAWYSHCLKTLFFLSFPVLTFWFQFNFTCDKKQCIFVKTCNASFVQFATLLGCQDLAPIQTHCLPGGSSSNWRNIPWKR